MGARCAAVIDAQRQVERRGDERETNEQTQEQRERLRVRAERRAEEAVDEGRQTQEHQDAEPACQQQAQPRAHRSERTLREGIDE